MLDLTGKTIIVTGASSGIGAGTVKALEAAGANVMAAARRQDRLETLQSDQVAIRKTDVTSHADMIGLAEDTIKRFGKIDGLVNNAGIMPLSLYASRKVDEWDRMVDVNIKGVLYGIDAVLSHMLENGSGDIVSVSSVAGHRVGPASGVYSGTKFAVRAIMEGLRQETTGKVRTTIICPGAVTTELASTITDEAVLGSLGDRFNFEFLKPEDIANAIVYALSQPAHVSVNEVIVRPSGQDQ